jgi:tRNA1Val (adenine37-N6)-methyltransferase
MDFLPLPDETLNTFSNRRLKIVQRKGGYRFSIDAVLLSQFVKLRRNEGVIDLGTGCGILPLLLSQKATRHSFVGVEVQKALADLALKNVRINDLESRITILRQDFRTLPDTLPPGSFDVVISNPPYRRRLSGRINPSEEKAIARHEIRGSLADLISVASYLLPSKGRCYLIYPATRTVDLFVTLRGKHLEPKRVQLVYPHPDEGAKFILVEAVKTRGVELKTLPPLVLNPAPRAPTP